MKPTDEPIIIKQTFDAPIEDVWNAITETERMKQWFFDEIQAFEPTEGFETQFDVECDGKHYLHDWRIAEVIPQQRIVYDWSYKGYAGRGLVTWELKATTDGTMLTLTNTVVEAFPEDDPAFNRESGEAGWKYFINDRLKSYLRS